MPVLPPKTLINARKFLDVIDEKKGRALKWDLYKIAGSEFAFNRWITNFLQKEKFVESVKKERKTFFRKTKRGEILHKTLKDWRFVAVFRRLGGKRLKS